MRESVAETVIELADPAATRALGAALAAVAGPGDVIALTGDLGAGKSELARGFIRAGLGPDEDVPSPTFTLVQTYAFPEFEVWHMDLYRLERPDDALELGIDEAFAEAVCLIEWPERLGPYLPADHLSVLLEVAGPGRRATLVAEGPFAAKLAEVTARVG